VPSNDDHRIRDTKTEPPEGWRMVLATGVIRDNWFPIVADAVRSAPNRYPHWLPMPPGPGGANAEA